MLQPLLVFVEVGTTLSRMEELNPTTLCLKTLLGSFHSLSACTLKSCSSDLQHRTKSELKVQLQKSQHQHYSTIPTALLLHYSSTPDH